MSRTLDPDSFPPSPNSTIKSIFLEISERAPHQRTRELDARCGGDATLRAAVEELLWAHDQAGRFMAGPTVDPKPPADAASLEPRQIGPYKLLQNIGEGGFGAVYMAEQESPVRRRV